MLTQRDFRTSSCIDGVVAMPRRFDGVVMTTRASTRLADVHIGATQGPLRRLLLRR